MITKCATSHEEWEQRAALWRWMALSLLALAAMLAPWRSAGAQDAGNGFLFGVPHATFGLRVGYDAAMAQSDLFSFVTNDLTLKRSDFSSPTVQTDFGFNLSPRVDAVLGFGYSRSVAQSQYRGWLDNNNLPIQQGTEFTRVPLTVNLKAYLQPPGRSLGRFAWVPARVAPYVGAGVGSMWYKFRQSGDFIDTTTTNVFNDTFSSSGWTPMADVFTGADFSISPSMALTVEARYAWAKGALSNDFAGFNRLDLSGVSLTGGLTFRY